ncbi:hypothetical protein CASFOL_009741 [Castilleja foliolosa]|uniref:NAC domain-containing protein n=1 Tax=Castilleja foliolosa TaxID=1961234 RepID=A0ABD3DUN7_9LAMI
MDHERNIITENENHTDEFMLPGFRFHPTDEELVGFYLRRKIMHKPLSIELIKQLDIYKFDPWDLPKLATTGEKEWYFYCPRDRKYRNSARPNRVTGAGFWKATGTDRPIYSSEGSKCIGLKKSLVFYKGRAAKGIKTDWMMHEFRLPSAPDSVNPKKYLDKNIPANEAWAICRIFKKANSSTQRALSQSWVSPIFDNITTSHHTIDHNALNNVVHFSSSSKITNLPLQFNFRNDIIDQSSFSPLHFPPCKPLYGIENNNKSLQVYTNNGSTQCDEIPELGQKCPFNDASLLLNDLSSSIFDTNNVDLTRHEFVNGFSTDICHTDQNNVVGQFNVDEECGLIRSSMGYSYNLPMMWDYSSPCPSELSTSYSTNNC